MFVPILGEADVGSGRYPGTSALYQARQRLFSRFHENSKKLFIPPEPLLSTVRPGQENHLIPGNFDPPAKFSFLPLHLSCQTVRATSMCRILGISANLTLRGVLTSESSATTLSQRRYASFICVTRGSVLEIVVLQRVIGGRLMIVTTVGRPQAFSSSPEPVAPQAAPVGFLDQSWPVQVILASFVAVTIPISIYELLRPGQPLTWIYIWLFGMTHFFITFAVYFQSATLRHFLSSWKNRCLFLLAPALILVGFDLLHVFRVGTEFPLFAGLFWGAIRLIDFNHFNRQSFGVMQLLKARTKVKAPVSHKSLENLYFMVLSANLFWTFLAGGVHPMLQPNGPLTIYGFAEGFIAPALPLWSLQICALVGGVIQAVLTAVIAWRLSLAKPTAEFEGRQTSVYLYFAFQSLSPLLAIIYLPLYPAALAIHYVEYHLLMVPRCFHSKLDESSRLDRAYGWLRARPLGFYSVVVFFAGVATALGLVGMSAMGRVFAESPTGPTGYLLMIAVFDGIFVFHYFVEMFIWRFSDPFFRQTLAPLYFAPKASGQ